MHFPEGVSLSNITCLPFFKLLYKIPFLYSFAILPPSVAHPVLQEAKHTINYWAGVLGRWPRIFKTCLLSKRRVEIKGPFGKCPNWENWGECGAHLVCLPYLKDHDSQRLLSIQWQNNERERERGKGEKRNKSLSPLKFFGPNKL